MINGTVIDNNMPTPEEEKDVKTDEVTSLASTITFTTNGKTVVVTDEYYQSGLLVLQNEYGYRGYYSLHYGKYLVNPMFIPELIQYEEIVIDSNVGYFIYLKYRNNYYIWDALGNLIYNGDEEAYVSTVVINEDVYSILNMENSKVNYKYTSTGLVQVANLPKEEDKEVVEKEEDIDKDKLEFGDLFVGDKLDLTPYGLVGHYIVNSGILYTVFDQYDNKLSTFVLPNGVKARIVEGNIMYQEYIPLPHTARDYTYSVGDNYNVVKYKLNTYVIDVVKGNTKTINCDYIIHDLVPYKDEQGVYNYYLALIQNVGKEKELKSNETYLIDKDFNLIQNVTGYEVTFYKKLDNGYYYNSYTDVIYNSQLVEVAYIGDMNPVFYEKEGLFIGRMDGLYGAVNLEGKVVIPFEYYSLWPLDSDLSIKENCLIASKRVYDEENYTYVTQYYRVNISNGSAEFIGKGDNVNKIYNGLYLTKMNNAYLYMSQSSIYSKVELDPEVTGDYNNYAVRSLRVFNSKYAITKTFDYVSEEYNEYTGQLERVNKVNYNVFNISPFKTQMITFGTEVKEAYNLNLSAATSKFLVLGKNDLDIPNGYSKVYYRLNMNTDYIYAIKSENEIGLNVYDAYNYPYQVTQIYNYDDSMYYYYLTGLVKGETYYLHVTDNESSPSHSQFEVYLSKHEIDSMPLIMDLQNTSGVVNPGNSECSYVYIPKYNGDTKFDPEVYYTLTSSNVPAEFFIYTDSYYSNCICYGETSYNLELSNGPYYIKVYHKNSNSTSDIHLTLKPTSDINLYEGECLQQPITLKRDGDPVLDSSGNPTYDYYGNIKLEVANKVDVYYGNKRYYKYENTNDVSTVVRFEFKTYRLGSSNTASVYYQFYNSNFEPIGSTYSYGSTFSKEVILDANEVVYIGLYANYSSYDLTVEIEPTDALFIENKTLTINSTNTINFYNSGRYIYKFKTNKDAYCKYSHSTYTYDCTINSITYYDKKGNTINVGNLVSDTEYYVVFEVLNNNSYSASFEYTLMSNVHELTSSSYYTPTSSSDYFILKYTNNTNVDKYVTFTSFIEYGYAYLSVLYNNLSIASSSGSKTTSVSLVIPAKTTYYIRTYGSYYNYEMNVTVSETRRLDDVFSVNVESYGTSQYAYQCEKSGVYALYLDNLTMTNYYYMLTSYTTKDSIYVNKNTTINGTYYYFTLTAGEAYLFSFNNNGDYDISERINLIFVK